MSVAESLVAHPRWMGCLEGRLPPHPSPHPFALLPPPFLATYLVLLDQASSPSSVPNEQSSASWSLPPVSQSVLVDRAGVLEMFLRVVRTF